MPRSPRELFCKVGKRCVVKQRCGSACGAGAGPAPTSLWVPGWGQNHAQSGPRWPVPPSVVAVLWPRVFCVPPGLAVTSHSGTNRRNRRNRRNQRCITRVPVCTGGKVAIWKGFGCPSSSEMKREGLEGIPFTSEGTNYQAEVLEKSQGTLWEMPYPASLGHKKVRTISAQRPSSPKMCLQNQPATQPPNQTGAVG